MREIALAYPRARGGGELRSLSFASMRNGEIAKIRSTGYVGPELTEGLETSSLVAFRPRMGDNVALVPERSRPLLVDAKAARDGKYIELRTDLCRQQS
jgi:hypothetical protein